MKRNEHAALPTLQVLELFEIFTGTFDHAVQRVFGVAGETPVLDPVFEQPVYGPCGMTGRFLQPLGGPAGRSRQGDFLPLPAVELEKGTDQRGFARSGTAGDDQDLLPDRK